MGKRKRNPLQFFDEFPPKLCRWFATKKHGTMPMSARDIATVSGLSSSGVDKLSKLMTWEHVELGTLHRFSLACGINLFSTARQREKLKRRALVFLKNGTPSQIRMLAQYERDLCSRGKSPT
jgi:hypothetical protein